MGCRPFLSSSVYDTRIVEVIKEVKLPNPDPSNFKIVKYFEKGVHLVVEVHYPDCTNFEGNKIMVYTYTTIEDLKQLRSLDPHFHDNNKYLSPIARFVPTKQGWELAIKFLDLLIQE